MNNKYGEEWRDWLTLLDVSVQKWLRGVGLAGFIDQVDSMMSIMKWIWWKNRNGSQCLVCRFKNGLEGQTWQYWLVGWTWWWIWWNEADEKDKTGSHCMACWFETFLVGKVWQAWSVGLIIWVQGSVGGSTVEGGQPELERHHCLLKGIRQQEEVADNNCVGDARAQSVCVRAAEYYKYAAKNSNFNVIRNSIKNTYNTIVLWLHINWNCNVVQDSINITCNKF